MFGGVKCGKIERGKNHPSFPGFEKISAYSNGPKVWQPLSPFNLGPFSVTEKYNPYDQFENNNQLGWKYFHNEQGHVQTIIVLSFERYWQGGKVYPNDLIDPPQNFDHSVATFNGKILGPSFYQRRVDILTNPNRDKKDIRHPLPKKKYGLPIQGFYSGEFVDYITSRKKYYCPSYRYFAFNTPTYQELLKKHQNGENLLICGPDGLDTEITEQNMRELISNPKIIFGHELVLCCMLSNLLVWE